MIIIKIQLLVFTVASLFVSSQCGSLNMEVRGHDMECLYLTKEKGDSIECFLSVSAVHNSSCGSVTDCNSFLCRNRLKMLFYMHISSFI